MFQQAVETVRDRISHAPVADYLREEAERDLRRLIEAHSLDLAEMEVRDTEKMSEESTVSNEPASADHEQRGFGSLFPPPSNADIERDNRRMAAQLAVSRDGSFNENSAQAIYDFLKA